MITFSNKENLIENIENEMQIINSYLQIQTALTGQLSVFINADTDKINLDNAIINLNRLKQNVTLLKNLLDVLENLKSTNEFLTDEGLQTYIKDYNSLYSQNITTVFSYTSNIERFIHEISLNITDVVPFIISEKETEKNKEADIVCSMPQTSYNSLVNNTLIISETRNEVILPYNLENLKLYYNNHLGEYSSIEEIVKQNYTLPISHFKPYAISRFKEAYKLVKKRAHGTRVNAISLAFEMLTNYNIHPAIIASCKTIDDLDVYLACLDEDELDDFKAFDIRYEIPPTVVLKNNKIEDF